MASDCILKSEAAVPSGASCLVFSSDSIRVAATAQSRRLLVMCLSSSCCIITFLQCTDARSRFGSLFFFFFFEGKKKAHLAPSSGDAETRADLPGLSNHFSRCLCVSVAGPEARGRHQQEESMGKQGRLSHQGTHKVSELSPSRTTRPSSVDRFQLPCGLGGISSFSFFPLFVI